MPSADIIGVEIKVTTCLNETFQGRIYSWDDDYNLLVLSRGNESSRDFMFLNLSYIKSVEMVDKNKVTLDVELPTIKVEAFLKEADLEIQRASRPSGQVNTEASEEAQNLFKELSKTYSCVWEDLSILLTDLHVKIKPPYEGQESLEGPEKSVQRILNVLQKVKTKINVQ